jgi:hypothetical protein
VAAGFYSRISKAFVSKFFLQVVNYDISHFPVPGNLGAFAKVPPEIEVKIIRLSCQTLTTHCIVAGVCRYWCFRLACDTGVWKDKVICFAKELTPEKFCSLLKRFSPGVTSVFFEANPNVYPQNKLGLLVDAMRREAVLVERLSAHHSDNDFKESFAALVKYAGFNPKLKSIILFGCFAGRLEVFSEGLGESANVEVREYEKKKY